MTISGLRFKYTPPYSLLQQISQNIHLLTNFLDEEMDRRKDRPLLDQSIDEPLTEDDRRNAVIEARKQQLEDEMEAMKNADSDQEIEDGDPRNPFSEDSDLENELDHDTDEEDREAEDLKECTFKPNINKNNFPARTVQDLIEWGKQKHHRMLETKIKINCFGDNDFNPKVNRKSKKLAGRRKGRIEDRLLKLGEQKKKNLKRKRKEATAGLFNPIIGNKTKEILEKKR